MASNNSKKGLGLELSTIAVIASALFLWIAVFTFQTQDPSLFTQSTERALNACGPFGAYLASFFLQFFGLATFLIPVGFLFVAAQIHTKEGLGKALSSLAGVSVSVIALTVFLSVRWKTWNWSETEFLTGGVFGAWLSAPLEKWLNQTGASIVSFAFFLAMLVISTPIGVATFLSKLIHASSVILFRVSKLVATYTAYYSAVALNALAKFIGMQAKKSFEQIKERAEAYRLAKHEAQLAITDETGTVETPKSKKAAKAAAHGETEAAIIAAAGPEISSAQSYAKAEADFDADEEAEEADEATAEELEDDSVVNETEVIGVASEPETSVISVADLRKQSDLFEAGPVIEKAAATTTETKPKFKFEKKRGKWRLPVIDFLKKVETTETAIDKDRLKDRARVLADKLAEFGIDGEVTAI
jgi:DNA segregation ATPase FtsK/SpoIIIE-like protein